MKVKAIVIATALVFAVSLTSCEKKNPNPEGHIETCFRSLMDVVRGLGQISIDLITGKEVELADYLNLINEISDVAQACGDEQEIETVMSVKATYTSNDGSLQKALPAVSFTIDQDKVIEGTFELEASFNYPGKYQLQATYMVYTANDSAEVEFPLYKVTVEGDPQGTEPEFTIVGN